MSIDNRDNRDNGDNRDNRDNRYRTILFDLDGTLTDSGPGIIRSVQYALEAFGIEEKDEKQLRRFVGPPLMYSFQTYYGLTKEEAERAVEKYRERYLVTGIYENEPYPGIPELLLALHEAGKKVAVATSKPEKMARIVLDHFKLTGCFDVIAGAGLHGEHETKPELMGIAFEQLGLTEEDKRTAIMVGDRFYDIEGAAAFGIDSAGVTYGYAQPGELEKAGATWIAPDTESLRKILLG